MRKIHAMKITANRLLAYLAIGLLCGCQAPAGKNTEGETNSFYSSHFSVHRNVWSAMRPNFRLLTAKNERNSQKELHWYLTHRRSLHKVLSQSAPYIYYIYQSTQQKNMPAEVALIPAVESNYNPFLYSVDGAVGLWQLMPGTASGLSIKINWWYDGRRNVVDSTKAALTYIGYLDGFFHGNWLKVFASYDSGAGTVERADRIQRRHLGYNNYWTLHLPQETKRYTPKIIALAMIIKNPKKYNVVLPTVPNKPFFAPVKCDKSYSIKQIAQLAHVSINEIRLLNAGFRRSVTPSDHKYSILLPISNIPTFDQNTELMHNAKNSSNWHHYVVKNGDTLSGIAHKYHVNIKLIKRVNGLKNNILHARQNLIIPSTNAAPPYASALVNESIAEDHIPGPMRVTYKVKAGDTVQRIARIYGLKEKAILYWNNITKHTVLTKGEQLLIWLSPREYAQTRFYHYQVKPGDSLIRIGHQFHVDAKRIKLANNLKADNLRIGQKLLIPAPLHWVHKRKLSHIFAHHSLHMLHGKHYTVKEGDSLYSIAKKFNTHGRSIALVNHLRGKNPLLHIGELLVIPVGRG